MNQDVPLRMPTKIPTAKLLAATAATFIAPILLYLFKHQWPDLPLPANADDLMDSLVQGIIFALAALVTGYLKRPAARDKPIHEPRAPNLRRRMPGVHVKHIRRTPLAPPSSDEPPDGIAD